MDLDYSVVEEVFGADIWPSQFIFNEMNRRGLSEMIEFLGMKMYFDELDDEFKSKLCALLFIECINSGEKLYSSFRTAIWLLSQDEDCDMTFGYRAKYPIPGTCSFANVWFSGDSLNAVAYIEKCSFLKLFPIINKPHFWLRFDRSGFAFALRQVSIRPYVVFLKILFTDKQKTLFRQMLFDSVADLVYYTFRYFQNPVCLSEYSGDRDAFYYFMSFPAVIEYFKSSTPESIQPEAFDTSLFLDKDKSTQLELIKDKVGEFYNIDRYFPVLFDYRNAKKENRDKLQECLILIIMNRFSSKQPPIQSFDLTHLIFETLSFLMLQDIISLDTGLFKYFFFECFERDFYRVFIKRCLRNLANAGFFEMVCFYIKMLNLSIETVSVELGRLLCLVASCGDFELFLYFEKMFTSLKVREILPLMDSELFIGEHSTEGDKYPQTYIQQISDSPPLETVPRPVLYTAIVTLNFDFAKDLIKRFPDIYNKHSILLKKLLENSVVYIQLKHKKYLKDVLDLKNWMKIVKVEVEDNDIGDNTERSSLQL